MGRSRTPAPATDSNHRKAARDTKSRRYSYLFKLLLLGDSGTGKTALVHRYEQDSFRADHFPTIGVDFVVKTLTLPSGDCVKLQIWDTAGQERFRTITASYYRGTHAAVIVYDATSRETFQHVRHWIEEVRAHVSSDVIIAVVASKVDLKGKSAEFYGASAIRRDLEDEAAKDVAGVFEVSSKTGEGVGRIFQLTVNALVAREAEIREAQERKEALILSLTNEQANKNSCC